MTYPITLTRQNAIIDTGDWREPLPLLDIPANISKENDQYVFYCTSVEKDDNAITRRGDGSAENPFVDVNYALEVLCCYAQKMCADCAGLLLIVTGTINYFICAEYDQHAGEYPYYDGNGVIEIDLREANFTIRSDIYSGCGCLIFRLKGIRVLGKDVISFVSSSGDQIQDDITVVGGAPGFIGDAVNCYFSFTSFKQDVTSSAPNTTCDAGYLISSCENCEFHIDSIEVVSSNSVGEDDKTIWVDAISHNRYCDFHIPAVRYNMDGISGRVSGNINIYSNNGHCTFNSCNAYLSMTVGPSDSQGCGFVNNYSSTWNGENRGYCYSWLDHEWGDGGKIYDDCTLNSNCLDGGSSSVPESSVPESSGKEYHGSVTVIKFARRLMFRLFSLNEVQHEGACKFDIFLTQINCFWNFSPCSGSQDNSKSFYYGKLDTVDGYVEEWEDEDGTIVSDCMSYSEIWCENGNIIKYDYDNDIAVELPDITGSALESANADMTKFINGELYDIPHFTDYPPSATGWKGFQNYYRCSDGGTTLKTVGSDKLECSTITRADFYSAWGETPCTYGDGFGHVTIPTFVFQWEPDSDYPDEEPPTQIVLKDAEGNSLTYEFGKECCPTGTADVDRDMLTLITCRQEGDAPACKWVIRANFTENS